jgi:ABC-type uncharacterized transport system involved in gliding motility auxiliary subunit
MNTKWLQARQTKYGAYVAIYLLVIVAVLATANWLASTHDKSIDTTSNKRFSLSDQTEKVVKNLKSDVNIKYFDQQKNFGTAKDVLDRYNSLSSKLHVEYIDPDKKPSVAKAMGVKNYGATYILANGKTEEAKSVTEEEVTGALVRALKGGQRTVCFVTGSGEHSIEGSDRSSYSNVKEALEKNNYKTKTISLLGAGGQVPPPAAVGAAAKAPAPAGGPEVPADCTVLIVGGPKYDYQQPAVDAIKKFVENGGHALFLLDPPISLGRDETSPNEALVKLLESWGVTLHNDIALDTSGIGQIFGLSEVVPLVTNYDTHVIVRDMKEVATAFPLSRTLDVKSGDKTTVEKLFSTSDNSYATNNLKSQEIRIDTKKDKKGPLTLAAAGTYSGKGRFVVVGSSNWIGNNYLRFNGNRDLFLNMMNWLSADEDLISIRPKEPADQAVNVQKLGQSIQRIFFASIVFLPLIVIASGVAVWWKRR